MAYLSLSLLGPFQAWTANGVFQPFRTLKERALLAYLAVENSHPHRREVLAEMFWPNRSDGVARNNLRQALYGIRQVIGETGFEHIFMVSADEVQINLSDQMWLDLTAFNIHIQSAHRHYHLPGNPCASCLQHLHNAVELYRGPFLEDVVLEKNNQFDAWVEERRLQCYQMQVDALESLVEEYESARDYTRAALYAERQAQTDEFKESNYRHLMTLLARSGRKMAALEQYDLLQERVKTTSQAAPQPETMDLAVRIKAGEYETPGQDQWAARLALPEYLTPFIGREMELAQLSQFLSSPACRLISLIGPGGVGKSRLAVQSASLMAYAFADGVFFVSLDAVSSVDRLPEVICRGIGLVPSGSEDLRTILLNYLSQKQLLLIVDNYEHLLDSKALLMDILQAAPLVKILVTSRERLHLQAEFLLHLNGLPFAMPSVVRDQLSLSEGTIYSTGKPGTSQAGQRMYQLVQSDALRLLLERASRVRPARQSQKAGETAPVGTGSLLPVLEDPIELEGAVRICQLVEGLPLGIELAASWARDYSFVQIADEVQRNLEFLQSSFQDLPERHRSLLASFEHSWDLLSESEREVFCKLSIFPGSFSVVAAQTVAGAAMPWLVQLEDKSLVRRTGPGRYDLHPLIRQYAGQKLRQYSRRIEDQARRQHAQFFSNFMKQREMDLKGVRQAESLQEVEADLENVLAAWDWAVEHHDCDLLDSAATAMMIFMDAHSRWQEGESCFRSAVTKIQDLQGDPYTSGVLAYLMAVQGWFCCRLTRFAQGEELLLSGLNMLNDHDNLMGRAFAHFALGFLYIWMSRYQEALLHLSSCRTTAERSGDQWVLAWARELLTEIAFESGQTGFSEAPFLETLRFFEQIGEQRGSSRALNYLGYIALAQNRYGEAKNYFDKLLTIVEKLGDIWGAAGGFNKLGLLAAAREDYQQAYQYHQRSLALFQKTGDQRRTGYAFRELGEIAATLGDAAKAESCFRQSLEIVAHTRSTPLAQEVLAGIAATLMVVDRLGNNHGAGQTSRLVQAAQLLEMALSEPIGDRLTARRVGRLVETLQAGLPVDTYSQARKKVQQRTVWNGIESLLRAPSIFLLQEL